LHIIFHFHCRVVQSMPPRKRRPQGGSLCSTFNCKITSNTLCVLVMLEVEMFKLASESIQRKCAVFKMSEGVVKTLVQSVS